MTDDFLKKLQVQAQKQAILEKKRLLPEQFDFITSLVGNHPVASLALTSLLGALLWELLL